MQRNIRNSKILLSQEFHSKIVDSLVSFNSPIHLFEQAFKSPCFTSVGSRPNPHPTTPGVGTFSHPSQEVIFFYFYWERFRHLLLSSQYHPNFLLTATFMGEFWKGDSTVIFCQHDARNSHVTTINWLPFKFI